MPGAADYTARELLRDRSQIEIRALRREHEADMLAAVENTSAQSLQRRLFVMKRCPEDHHLSTAFCPGGVTSDFRSLLAARHHWVGPDFRTFGAAAPRCAAAPTRSSMRQ
jgi:hypothetical protein